MTNTSQDLFIDLKQIQNQNDNNQPSDTKMIKFKVDENEHSKLSDKVVRSQVQPRTIKIRAFRSN